MATVRVFTAERMEAIEEQAIVGGSVVGDDLILERNNAETVNAGDVRGPQGDMGPPGPIPSITLSYPGGLTAIPCQMRWYATKAYTIANVVICVGTAPTGASIKIDVNKNGTTIFTTQANRPEILAGAFVDLGPNVPDITGLVSGDYLTIDIDQVGSTIPGSDLVIQIVLESA